MKLALTFTAICCFVSISLALTVTDDTGTPVTVSKPATRLISLAPHLTEIAFAIGAGNKVIATSRYSDYPKIAATLPVVADYAHLDLETILTLHPDLILLWGKSPTRYQQLKQFNFRVYRHDPKTLTQLADSFYQIGRLTGNSQQAQQVKARFLEKLTSLRQHYQQQRQRVFIQIAAHPLMTVAQSSLLAQAVHVCGGETIFPNIKKSAFSVDREAVIAANPDYLILLDQSPADDWPRDHMKSKVIKINPDLLVRASPRLIHGVEKLCRLMSE